MQLYFEPITMHAEEPVTALLYQEEDTHSTSEKIMPYDNPYLDPWGYILGAKG